MKHTIRTHLVGLAGSVGAVIISVGLVVAYLFVATPRTTTLPEPGLAGTVPRRIEHGVFFRPLRDASRPRADGVTSGAAAHGWRYTCSDGARLTCLRYRYSSSVGAHYTLSIRLSGEYPAATPWQPRQTWAHGRGVLVSTLSPVRVNTGEGEAQAAWVYAEVVGSDLVEVYGASREDVLDVVAANPDLLWTTEPRTAPN